MVGAELVLAWWNCWHVPCGVAVIATQYLFSQLECEAIFSTGRCATSRFGYVVGSTGPDNYLQSLWRDRRRNYPTRLLLRLLHTVFVHGHRFPIAVPH